jgi:hypothetical protein
MLSLTHYTLLAQNALNQNISDTSNWRCNSAQITLGSAWGGFQWVNAEIYNRPIYYSEGITSFDIKGLSFGVEYYLSDVGFKGGRANRLRLRYDPLRNHIKKPEQPDITKLNYEIDSLNQIKERLSGQLAYAYLMQKDRLRDSSNRTGLDSMQVEGQLSEEQKLDTISINYGSNEISTLSAKYTELNDRLDILTKRRNHMAKLDSMMINRKKGILGRLKNAKVTQFQLGHMSPALSSLMLENSRLLGLQCGSNIGRFHTDIVVGKLSPQFLNQNPGFVQNEWQRLMNKLNKRNGHLTYVRMGYGKSLSKHIFLSMLHGTEMGLIQTRQSLNVEMAGGVPIGRGLFQIKMAQRLRAKINNSPENVGGQSDNYLKRGAFEGCLQIPISKYALKMESRMKWIGPEYFTVGNPFLRGDNAVLNKRVGYSGNQFFQPSISYSYCYNNVLKLFDYQNRLAFWSFEFTSKPLKSLFIRASFSPTHMIISNNEQKYNTRNEMFNGSLSYQKVWKAANLIATACLSEMMTLWDSLVVRSQSQTLNLSFIRNNGYEFTASYQQMNWQSDDQLGNNVKLVSLTGSLKRRQWNMGLGMTGSASGLEWNGGARFWLQWPISRKASLNISAEKFPQLSFNNQALPSSGYMPYLLDAKLIFQIK